jgi:hypothetical protein
MASIQLSEDVGMYVDKLRAQFDAIDEVWLIGDHVNEPEKRDSAWELLAFADADVRRAIAKSRQWHRDDVELLVVVDGDHFAPAWGEAHDGSLAALGWRQDTPQTASYQSRVDPARTRAAFRVR